MQFPLNLFHPSCLSVVTTEASKKLGWVTTSISHLSFWQLWFPEEIDRSHSLFCFEVVNSPFLKMASLLLINLFPTLYHCQPHEVVFSPQNLSSVWIVILILVSALQSATTAAAKRGTRTALLLPSHLAPATLKFCLHQYMEKKNIL